MFRKSFRGEEYHPRRPTPSRRRVRTDRQSVRTDSQIEEGKKQKSAQDSHVQISHVQRQRRAGGGGRDVHGGKRRNGLENGSFQKRVEPLVSIYSLQELKAKSE